MLRGCSIAWMPAMTALASGEGNHFSEETKAVETCASIGVTLPFLFGYLTVFFFPRGELWDRRPHRCFGVVWAVEWRGNSRHAMGAMAARHVRATRPAAVAGEMRCRRAARPECRSGKYRRTCRPRRS